MIEIEHTWDGGTLVAGTARGDGTAAILKANGFRWMPSIGQWGIRGSRDHAPHAHVIRAAADALRAAGSDVTVTLAEADSRTFAEAEAARYERAEDRAGRLAQRATTAAARSEAAFAAAQERAAGIPFGQPVLVGHHSEGRHRRDLARIDRARRTSYEQADAAADLTRAADVAAARKANREDLPTTLRRLERLNADLRDVQRKLDGHTRNFLNGAGEIYSSDVTGPATGNYRGRLETRKAELAEEIAYWEAHVAAAEAAGQKVWSKADFAPGDYVLHRGRWYEVRRVNAKTLTVPSGLGSWTNTMPYNDVSGRLSAAEYAEKTAAAQPA